MPIYDSIDPSLVDAWLRRALRDNVTLMASHGGRFWQEESIPSVAQGLRWPYIFWQMREGTKKSTKSILPGEYIGQQTSVWNVWSVRRFTGRPDKSAFNPDILNMRAVLTGIECTPVYNGPTIIGYIRGSTLAAPEEMSREDSRDDDISILSRAIVIKVTHK